MITKELAKTNQIMEKHIPVRTIAIFRNITYKTFRFFRKVVL